MLKFFFYSDWLGGVHDFFKMHSAQSRLTKPAEERLETYWKSKMAKFKLHIGKACIVSYLDLSTMKLVCAWFK
jgi:hypothetical protein